MQQVQASALTVGLRSKSSSIFGALKRQVWMQCTAAHSLVLPINVKLMVPRGKQIKNSVLSLILWFVLFHTHTQNLWQYQHVLVKSPCSWLWPQHNHWLPFSCKNTKETIPASFTVYAHTEALWWFNNCGFQWQKLCSTYSIRPCRYKCCWACLGWVGFCYCGLVAVCFFFKMDFKRHISQQLT